MSEGQEKRTKHARITVTICPSCNRASRKSWRCEWCGRDLATDSTSKGVETL